jgi:quinol monooxygenase YgiN
MSDLYVAATAKAQEGAAAQLRAVLEALVAPTRQESGNLAYNLYTGADGKSFLFFEHWASQEALDLHGKTAHFQKMLHDSLPLTDGAMDVKILHTAA